MSSGALVVIFLAVFGGLWVTRVVFAVRRERGKPKLGAADAYEGNLVPPLPPPGSGRHGTSGGHGHGGGAAGHGGHGGGISGHGGFGGHAGHDAGGFAHH
jgi:hypothetical protein